MDAAVHDEAVQQDKMQTIVTRSSPTVDDASARQAGEVDDVARRASESSPGDRPIVSSSGKSQGTAAKRRLANRAVCAAQGSYSRDRSRCGGWSLS